MTSTGLPHRVTRFSRIPHRLLTWGLPMGPVVLLRTRGRRSGLPRTVPVALYHRDGRQWLVAPFGDTHWVHNVRAHSAAELGRGRRFRRVRLREIDDNTKPEILRAYRRRFGLVPFVRDAFDATGHDDPSVFQQEADRHPIFLIEPRE
ncbi:nitroreductase family deazaflavin-dependent oxidoreductase [Actinomadura sp. 3N407]|uniref:nitroreductase family deazaflavin-dependent oxidoreductase n=1 Tax=Actinomadura sp. 3N407 TaxID=3457423 RepID=UPI003FCC8AF1